MESVKRLRNERGLSQQRLSEMAGINKVTLVHIETGKSSPNVDTLDKLARALGVEVADFFPKTEPSLFSLDTTAAEQGRPYIDASALYESLAQVTTEQRPWLEDKLSAKLDRAGDDPERRKDAFKDINDQTLGSAHYLARLMEHIPVPPGSSFPEEWNATQQWVGEFAPTFASELRGKQLEEIEQASKINEQEKQRT
jgi:transcriptional regulator with XRE-family HTH domain